jgi:lysophospholipase L1-like esterase
MNKSFFYQRAGASLALTCLLFLFIEPAAFAHVHGRFPSLVGPKQYYLALGNSLAFGYQPDWDFAHGYANTFFQDLKSRGVQTYINLACPGETSSTMIHGGCPYPLLRKYPYVGTQLDTAVNYLNAHHGRVSPVTLDIGANDLLPAIDPATCSVNNDKFNTSLELFDSNLTQVILPRLHAALLGDSGVTGDLVMNNYYDPFQNSCPQTVEYIQRLNQHLANDVQGYGIIVDTFSAFGGSATPNSNICSYTWMCSIFKDIHATNQGYSVIASTFEHTVGY